MLNRNYYADVKRSFNSGSLNINVFVQVHFKAPRLKTRFHALRYKCNIDKKKNRRHHELWLNFIHFNSVYWISDAFFQFKKQINLRGINHSRCLSIQFRLNVWILTPVHNQTTRKVVRPPFPKRNVCKTVCLHQNDLANNCVSRNSFSLCYLQKVCKARVWTYFSLEWRTNKLSFNI